MPATREIRVRLEILNLSGDVLSTISHRIEEGQVNMATDADGPTRSMSVSLHDPVHTLRLDSDSPAEGALFADRMLRAHYGVKVDGVGWVDVPVFTGPIVKVIRDDQFVNVECQGKEALALQPVWNVFNVEKGVAKVDAIRRIMRERAGESRFDLPDLAPKLAHPAVLAPEPPGPHKVGKGKKRHPVNFKGMSADTPWGLAVDIAESMSRQLFYDGHGRLRLRQRPGHALFTFDETLIESNPQIDFDMDEVRNAVEVTGRTLHEGKEKKDQIPTHVVSGRAVAPDTHSLSPKRLGWEMPDGTHFRRYIPERVSNDAIRSDQEASRRAHQILQDRLDQVVDISFDALPVPHLEELDKVRISYGDISMSFRLQRFSLPLTHDGVMSVGYVKRVTPPRRRHRRG